MYKNSETQIEYPDINSCNNFNLNKNLKIQINKKIEICKNIYNINILY